MAERYIYHLIEDPLPLSVGRKAEHLRIVYEMGKKIPITYCCTWDAHAAFKVYGEQVVQQLRDEIAQLIDPQKSYAVRSSANLEDNQDYSYAGQYTTLLDVKGLEAILQAIQEVWKSVKIEGMQAYQVRVGEGNATPKMAVIVQEMVSPLLSGVAFSKNPITGLDETIIEAVEGPGTALVQDGITPLRWVNKWGQWIEHPEGIDAYTEPIQVVVDQTKKIVKRFGQHVDLEWVYDGQDVYWVQLREITTSEDIHIYSNKLSKEFLPGMIKPLVWSVNIPLVNSAWVELLTEVIGDNDIEPESLARSFYYRAYFDTSTFGKIFDSLGMPRQALEINMGIVKPPNEKSSFRPSLKMVRLLPRLLGFLQNKWRFSKKIEQHFPGIEVDLREFAKMPTSGLSQDELLKNIDHLYRIVQEAAYYNIVVPMLMGAYNRALQGQLKYYEVGFEQFDLTRDLSSLDKYAPDVSLEQLSLLFNSLDPETQEQIRRSDYDAFIQMSGVERFQADVRHFFNQFGHLSDSGNDFSVTPWREDPDFILSLIASFQSIKGKKTAQITFEDLPARVPRRWLTGFFYQRARRFRYYREWVSSVYTFGYGLFRNYYLALGDHFVREGFLVDSHDITYLYDEEVRQVVAGECRKDEIVAKAAKRKLEIEEFADVQLPEVIYGDEAPPPITASIGQFHGMPASRGIYTGYVSVVNGLGDFNKVNDGDVIVIPYSDVGWTPLFSKAGAIIAQSGGILSHSSIVAREYNIPAVVSVANAFAIENNALVTVDGYLGDIYIHGTGENYE